MKKAIITMTELKTASDRWYEFHGLKCISTWHFLKYLGEDYNTYYNNGSGGHSNLVIEVSEESARKIKALNGPHYKTLLAVYKAQNMIE